MYKKLKSVMVLNNDNQSSLAELLDMSIGSISKRLSGQVEWSISEIEILCKRYDMTFEELFEKDE